MSPPTHEYSSSHSHALPSSSRHRVFSSVTLAVFFASGAAALLYQVIWQRMLAIFSGADVFSVTIIVSAFMGGLGLGHLVGGHVADRLPRWRCLLLFALAELAIAAFALVSKTFYYDFLYGEHVALSESVPILAIVLFLSLLWPTFFMGVSLPLLARGLTEEVQAASPTIGSLYGYNTLGAAAGAVCTTWILLRYVGFESCLQIGAAVNFACAVAAVPLGLESRRLSGRRPPSEPPQAESDPPPPGRARSTVGFGMSQWLLLYALSGAVALSLEIAWFRVLGVMLKSTSFTFGTLLAIYLFGIASGSIIGSRWRLGDSRDAVARFLMLQAGVAIYAALSLALIVGAADRVPALASLWSHFGGTEPIDIGQAFAQLARAPLSSLWHSEPVRLLIGLYVLLPVVLIGPSTFLMGLSFPYLQQAAQTDVAFVGRRLGWLLTANIGGSLLGSLLTGFILLPRLGTANTFRLLTATAGVFVFLWIRNRRSEGVRRRLGPPVTALAAILFALLMIPGGDVLWSKLHGVADSRLLFKEDAAGVAVIRRGPGESFNVMAGGLGLSWIPYAGIHTVLGAMPLMLHPDPKRIAVIGLGSGDTAYALAGRPEVAEVLVIEIIGAELELLHAFDARYGNPAVRVLLTDPRFKIVIGDGRAYVRRDPGKFDLIEADALRPSSAYSGNVYSLEYFSLLREHLKTNGLAVTWLPTKRVLHTFVQSFPYVLLLESPPWESIAIGSNEPIRYEPEALLARLDSAFVREHYRRAGIDIEKLFSTYIAKWTPTLIGPDDDRSQLTDVNSDLFAKDEFMVGGSHR